MALKPNEKKLVGIMMLVGGVAMITALGLPQWDAFMANTSQSGSLNEEIKSLDAQKANLGSQIALMEKNTAVPPGLKIRTYTEENREQIIKEMLDGVLGMATTAGNKFISLKPLEEQAAEQAAPEATSEQGTAQAPDGATADAAAQSQAAETAAPTATLSSFGYELSIRGTYNTIQGFLRALDEQKELMEISGIVLENEYNPDQPADADSNPDPSFPIRLTAKLRLVLQPA